MTMIPGSQLPTRSLDVQSSRTDFAHRHDGSVLSTHRLLVFTLFGLELAATEVQGTLYWVSARGAVRVARMQI